MKGTPVATLVTNSYFDQPVYLDKDYILLTPDSPVTDELTRRLKKWGYVQVQTDGKPKDTPYYLNGADQGNASSTIDENLQEEAQLSITRKFYLDFLVFTRNLMKKFQSEGALNVQEVTEWVKRAILIVRENKDFILRFSEVGTGAEDFQVTHAVNSTIIALVIADFGDLKTQMKLTPHRLIELGIACFLHEIGMLKLPEALHNAKRPLSPEEKRTLAAHTILGYRILKGFSVAEGISLAALEHHERVDGSGYPSGLKAERIDEYARLIAVACSYEAIVSRRPFKEAMGDGHSAITDLLRNSRAQYDDKVLKALVYTLSVFPVGTPVLLSNQSRGIVVKTDPEKPRCPVIKVLLDPEGKQLADPPLVQIVEDRGLKLLRVLSAAERESLRRAQ
jgi:HD-GYP domain-containing protein (c-di-GMP phosphodiesterase class II)